MELRRRRLAETIAWCSLQKLQNNPVESEDVKRRRALGERAVNHAYAAWQLEASSVFKWVTRGKVKQMRAEAMKMRDEARLDEIRPLAAQLRTVELQPAAFAFAGDAAALARMVESVCEARARLLHAEAGSAVELGTVPLGGGKILRYVPQRSTDADKSAAYDSKGFFDDAHSVPPWDTWVCVRGWAIVAYVPRALCGLAQRGIEVDPAECIRWADSAFVAETFGELAA